MLIFSDFARWAVVQLGSPLVSFRKLNACAAGTVGSAPAALLAASDFGAEADRVLDFPDIEGLTFHSEMAWESMPERRARIRISFPSTTSLERVQVSIRAANIDDSAIDYRRRTNGSESEDS